MKLRLDYTAERLEMKYSRCQERRIERKVADDVQCVCHAINNSPPYFQ